jgi:hypothetical protein
MLSGRAIHSKYSKALLFVTILGLAAGTAVAQGKGNGVEVRSLSPAVLETMPGRVLSVSFKVSNKTSQAEELGEVLQAPEGWTAVVPAASFELATSGSLIRVLAFSVPRAVASGRYEITYTVRSPRDYAVTDHETVSINVLPVSGLELLVEDSPKQAVAGETIQIAARVINRGNAPATVELKASAADKSCQTILDRASLSLEAGTSGVVHASVHTDPHATQSHILAVHLSASAAGQGGKPDAAAEATAEVEILPVESKSPDPYLSLPMLATVRVAGVDGKATVQAQVSGGGFLDERKTKSVNFSLTMPDASSSNTTFVGLREEYWLNYAAPNLDVRLGDNSYGLSYLTEYSRYGRGLEMSYHPSGPWSCKAYCLQSRLQEPDLNEEGLALRRALPHNGYLQANLIDKHEAVDERSSNRDTSLLSLSGGSDLLARQRLDFEVAQSRTTGGAVDQAYQVQLNGALWSGSYYSVSKQHGGPEFRGYFRDADYVQAGLSSPITRSLGAHVSYANWANGLSPQTAEESTARERLLQAGLTYQPALGWELTAELGSFHHRNTVAQSVTDTQEQVQRYGLGYSHGKAAARVELQLSRQKDNLTAEVVQPRQLDCYASYFVSDELSLSGFASSSTGGQANANSYLLGSANNVGVGATWRGKGNLSASLAYSRFGSSPGMQDQDQLTGQVNCRLRGGHEVKLEARQDSAFIGDAGHREYTLSYSVPFGLRLGKKTDAGQINGRVTDATSAAKPGLGKVIVTCSGGGGAVVTKADGTFSFRGLAPGQYTLQIRGGSLGAGRVPEAKMPLGVTVRAGGTTTVPISVTSAGLITGQVLIYRGTGGTGSAAGGSAPQHSGEVVVEGAPRATDADPNGKPAQASPAGAPVADVLVELSREGEAMRTATNGGGEFRFDGLRPGRYHLRVCDDQAPELYRVEQPEQDLEVVGGSNTAVEFRILPRTRRVKIVDEGSIRTMEQK